MAENVNILSRFSKLPDKNQATALVSQNKPKLRENQFWFSLVLFCILILSRMTSTISLLLFQFVGVKGIGKHRVARSTLAVHTDFSVQM